MKRLPKYFLISSGTFLIGLIAASIWFFFNQKTISELKPEITVIAENTIAEVTVGNEQTEEDDEFRKPLDDIWLESETTDYAGYTITKKCGGTQSDTDCQIKILKNGKTLARFESAQNYWLKYGLFNFLGKSDKQLIVHTYSGGAHCCYDYVIYDLKPTFRTIYDSRKLDSANTVGSSLIPVDIDGDGVFEFHQSVMTFDYFFASHADSVFPPAVFAYDRRKGRYDFANKKFPDFVLRELKDDLDWLDEWKKKYGNIPDMSNSRERRYILRKVFTDLVYAGREKQAWKFFDEEYNFEDKDEFRREIKKEFAGDVTYKSIYLK